MTAERQSRAAVILAQLLADPSRALDLTSQDAMAALLAAAPVVKALEIAAARPPHENGATKDADAPADGAPFLDVHEAAAVLGVSERWLYRRPWLPFARRISAKRVRYSKPGLLLWMQEQRGRGSRRD